MQSECVLLIRSREALVLVGTSLDTCVFVGQLSAGRIHNGIKHLDDEECTEALLSEIESRYTLHLMI